MDVGGEVVCLDNYLISCKANMTNGCGPLLLLWGLVFGLSYTSYQLVVESS